MGAQFPVEGTVDPPEEPSVPFNYSSPVWEVPGTNVDSQWNLVLRLQQKEMCWSLHSETPLPQTTYRSYIHDLYMGIVLGLLDREQEFTIVSGTLETTTLRILSFKTHLTYTPSGRL